MEQKKILWIVVAVCVFVLIIFGAALMLYAPSRSTGQNLGQAVAVTPAQINGISKDSVQTQSQIDPDSWVRDPGNTPGLDTTLQPSNGNINLTIVNGDNTAANYGTLDVTGLTGGTAAPVSTDAAQQLPLSAIPGQNQAGTALQAQNAQATQTSQNDAAAQNAGDKSTTVIKSEATPKKAETASSTKTVAKAAASVSAEKAAPAKTVKKTVTVTEFWIQTGSFSSKINAEKARETLAERYLNAEIFTKDVSGKTAYRVRVGPYKSKTEADYWLGTVKEIPDFSGSYVSEVKTKK